MEGEVGKAIRKLEDHEIDKIIKGAQSDRNDVTLAGRVAI